MREFNFKKAAGLAFAFAARHAKRGHCVRLSRIAGAWCVRVTV